MIFPVISTADSCISTTIRFLILSSYVHNTVLSKQLFYEAWNIYKTQKVIRQQPALNLAISMLKSRGLKIQLLNLDQFPSGWYYFEKNHRLFWDTHDCMKDLIWWVSIGSSCVLVHNNWIVGGEAKIYRFKELGLYKYDEGGYYPSTTNKYLCYQTLPKNATLGIRMLFELHLL